uniref:Outer capsid protein VP2 n=1 Tax=Changuinola virus TaxID=40052 RepID=U5YID2_9REOV|nr:outer capsid protein VP2 [Changuinola virus]
MTTEFTIAVANVDEKLCHDALFNDYDIVIDTSKKARLDANGKWDMKHESARRNIYMWGTDQLIDNAIKGKPGAESYLSVANSIDSVLGELKDENLENRDKIQNQVSQELKWMMNMQSQEWNIDKKRRPIIECKFGSIYAKDHHFESLIFYRNAIPKKQCSHLYLNQFNEHIYSDLHNIVQNTVYLIDYTYKVKCIDNKPFRYPIGVIFPYMRMKKLKYENEGKKEKCFRDHFNTFIHNNAEGEKDVFILKDAEVDKYEDVLGDTKDLKNLKDQLIVANKNIVEYQRIINENMDNIEENKHKKESGIFYMLNEEKIKRDSLLSQIAIFKENQSRCGKVNIRFIEDKGKEEEGREIVYEKDYDPKESKLNLDDDATHVYNGSYEYAMYKEIRPDGSLSNFQPRINMDEGGFNTADKIQAKYDSIENQRANELGKWLDIKRSTLGFYYLNDDIISGYGPLKIEGLLGVKYMETLRGDDKYTDLVNLLQYGEIPKKEINALNLCKMFTKYSKEHMNNRIQFIDDEEICFKFRNSLNTLFNQGIEKEKASISTIYKNGWTVHPINEKAFKIINDTTVIDHKKNVAKLGILISSVYGGYVDNDCPIHALRGGMLYANSFFGNVYDLLQNTFKWYIHKTEHNMHWKVPHKDAKIRPMVRMDVYENNFIKGRAGVCWSFSWNRPSTVDINFGYPHYQEDSNLTQSFFDEEKVNRFYQDMLNANNWNDVHTELDTLLNYEAQFYIKQIESDFYLDDKGILVTPDYYGKQIYYNVIANCNYKCVATTTNKTTDDKNEFKHSAAQRLLSPENWFLPFQREYDSVTICQGQAVFTTEQPRGRLERTYIDAIGRDKDFRDFLGCSEREIVDIQCPITFPSRYIPWKFFSQLFSLYVNFMPINIRNKIQGKEDRVKLYPNVQMYNIDYNVTNIYMGIYRIFIYGYNAKVLKNGRDAYLFLRNFQKSCGEEKLHLLKEMIPQLYNIISDYKNDNVDEFFAINFLFLLCGMNINSTVYEKTYVPICYCRSSNILITSVKLESSNMKNLSSSYLPYLSRFFGLKQHEEWSNANDLLINVRNKAINYYIGNIVISISKELEVCQTKLQNIAMWVGSKCGGVSECLLFFQAITYPKAAYILIVIGDEHMNYDDIYREVRFNYQMSFQSCKGVMLCKVFNDRIIDFKIIGTLKVRKMIRDFWGLSHDMLLIKSLGDIFGNAHLVTKLMNIS